MGAIDYLNDRGFSARKVGMRVVVSPASKLTAEVRSFIKSHRLELLAELAANDGVERRCHWTVSAVGYRPFTMIGEPITRAEALAAARTTWPSAEILE
ncbi:hypothetical protein [Pseudomonas sp. AN-1]|uniref:hypothetical protein n=1 Tax=Pseudomonas sp. AN-1 TaxID=3096605 RepID=UPI002A6AF996|nr:hypothetical protein [Pseudomonas sp. AN-1]WPP46621.1 hypothetical protein SK095_04310 [Pseudomonas sp. AN-1]